MLAKARYLMRLPKPAPNVPYPLHNRTESGVVAVPDERLAGLAAMYQPKKVTRQP